MAPTNNAYFNVLQTWCDGLLSLQIREISSPAIHGGIICPACGLLHGRVADASFPLLYLARTTGQQKYLDAAVAVRDWGENLSRPDGSWANDLTLNDWKGITVFGVIALAESLCVGGDLLPSPLRDRWIDRLAHAARYLDANMTMATGNINYPVTASLAFLLAGQTLHEPRYLTRAGEFAYGSLDYFTPSGLLFGEGHPQTGTTPKGHRAVDLAYNVEESLPALALYGHLTSDPTILTRVSQSLAAHLEFMLPDGAWDNGWASRSFKWTWWGSRTSDGCHPACLLLADRDPRFAQAAWRNLLLMQTCTHAGLLYGGPHLHLHGDPPCVHHTITHAKSLATVLHYAPERIAPPPLAALPRDLPHAPRHFPEIGTTLLAVGPWRATITDYDWHYTRAGHPTGGALSLLYHQALGPIFAASMTHYAMVEPSNQQTHRDRPHMPLTPRIECRLGDTVYTSLSDYQAQVEFSGPATAPTIHATGRLLDADGRSPAADYRYQLTYTFTEESVQITARCSAPAACLILPAISPHTELVQRPDAQTLQITKSTGILILHTDVPAGFRRTPETRVFNLVPGFEAVPAMVDLASSYGVAMVRVQTHASFGDH